MFVFVQYSFDPIRLVNRVAALSSLVTIYRQTSGPVGLSIPGVNQQRLFARYDSYMIVASNAAGEQSPNEKELKIL
jgi:hypothetical protein